MKIQEHSSTTIIGRLSAFVSTTFQNFSNRFCGAKNILKEPSSFINSMPGKPQLGSSGQAYSRVYFVDSLGQRGGPMLMQNVEGKLLFRNPQTYGDACHFPAIGSYKSKSVHEKCHVDELNSSLTEDVKQSKKLAQEMGATLTNALGQYTKGRSTQINAYLRYGKVELPDTQVQIDQEIALVETALRRMPKLPPGRSVYRAVPDDGIRSALLAGTVKVGDIVGDHAFLSTTTSIDALKSQQFYTASASMIIYEIAANRATPIPYPDFAHVAVPQNEALLERSLRFKINDFSTFDEPIEGSDEVRKVTYIRVIEEDAAIKSEDFLDMGRGKPGKKSF